jgi:hypothetical protein
LGIAHFEEYRVHWHAEKEKVGNLWNETERLFTQWDGKPMYPGTITHWFRKFLIKINTTCRSSIFMLYATHPPP